MFLRLLRLGAAACAQPEQAPAPAAAAAAATAAATHVRYLVVGAGPGGLQLAHYLESAGRDYLVLDSARGAASFFAAFPRWRQLISINKAEVGALGAASQAYAERHDWNSLLSDASHARARAPVAASTTDARLHAAALAPALRFPSWSDD